MIGLVLARLLVLHGIVEDSSSTLQRIGIEDFQSSVYRFDTAGRHEGKEKTGSAGESGCVASESGEFRGRLPVTPL